MPLNLSPTQVQFNERGNGAFKLPFQEQINFFRQKLNLPTEHYDDILKEAHDRAFVVAGAAKADLLTDLRAAVDKSISEGKSIQWFRKEFAAIVQKNGWEGWTGSDTKGGRDWRTRIIYRTNLMSSYAAGRYAQLTSPAMLKIAPYWKYLHNDTVAHPRPLHVSWSGLVLKHDDPWWQSHFPPNGWGCRCRITAVKASEYQGQQAPDDGTWIKKDRQGNEHEVQVGIDYGWDYAPGSKTDASLRTVIQQQLIRYDPAITRALSKDINKYINAHTDVNKFVKTALNNKALDELLWLGFVENHNAITSVSGVDVANYLVLLPSKAINHVEKSHQFDGQGQRPVTPDDYVYLQEILKDGAISKGENAATGDERIVAKKRINGELYRAVFEIRKGKRSRSVVLVSLNIKTR